MAYTTRLGSGSGTFANMMAKGFGIVTVMNAKIYDVSVLNSKAEEGKTSFFDGKTAEKIWDELKPTNGAEHDAFVCRLDTLKVANVTEEGPSKTVTGGQYSNPLIKFGKSARLEMQDALGRAAAIDALCGGIAQYNAATNGQINGLHFGEDFVGPKLIIGDSFFIDRETGAQVKVNIIFYQFLPDSIFNLTQDAEGDATVFDMNGDLLTTNIQVPNDAGTGTVEHGIFYSILPETPVVDTPSQQG